MTTGRKSDKRRLAESIAYGVIVFVYLFAWLASLIYAVDGVNYGHTEQAIIAGLAFFACTGAAMGAYLWIESYARE